MHFVFERVICDRVWASTAQALHFLAVSRFFGGRPPARFGDLELTLNKCLFQVSLNTRAFRRTPKTYANKERVMQRGRKTKHEYIKLETPTSYTCTKSVLFGCSHSRFAVCLRFIKNSGFASHFVGCWLRCYELPNI